MHVTIGNVRIDGKDAEEIARIAALLKRRGVITDTNGSAGADRAQTRGLIIEILRDHPDGLTASDIARRLEARGVKLGRHPGKSVGQYLSHQPEAVRVMVGYPPQGVWLWDDGEVA